MRNDKKIYGAERSTGRLAQITHIYKQRTVLFRTPGRTHPDPGLREVGPHGYLLPRAHVRVAIPLEGGLQLLQLLAGKVSPLPPLPLLF